MLMAAVNNALSHRVGHALDPFVASQRPGDRPRTGYRHYYTPRSVPVRDGFGVAAAGLTVPRQEAETVASFPDMMRNKPEALMETGTTDATEHRPAISPAVSRRTAPLTSI